mmetsp:Transcript_14891/g.26612  ORF Transcript_14891/g.26612 Transcript_14891/m.26612 type:complete len:525 (+) Transcript_14891:141-1715(+)
MRGLLALIALLVVVSVRGEINSHRVEELPGLGKVSGRQWSGYIEVPVANQDTTAHVHYWLVENSRGDPNATTMAWFQGGPGGSSMIAFFTENGPFTLNDYSLQEDGSLQVFENPHSWHTLPANMLYVEHPAPTGFSYCSPRTCKWTDESQAQVSYEFMVRFFKAYPEFAIQPFRLSGESYAGVLVPTLSEQILKHRTPENRHLAPWSLLGFALGNACPGNRVETCTPYSGYIGTQTAVDFRFFHGMISAEKYGLIQAACAGKWGTYESPGGECARLLEDPTRPVLSEAGDTYNMGGGYFLYDTCHTDLGLDTSSHSRKTVDVLALEKRLLAGANRTKRLYERSSRAQFTPHVDVLQAGSGTSGKHAILPNSGEYFCGQERMSLIYLNRAEVQRAIHVRRTDFQFSTSLHYEYTAHSLLPLYDKLLVDELDILQYSGDADPCVPYLGTQKWIKQLGLQTRKAWAPWSSPEGGNQPAGYLHVMESHNKRRMFTFATVRDAGHMVPRYKGRASRHLMQRYLNGFRGV